MFKNLRQYLPYLILIVFLAIISVLSKAILQDNPELSHDHDFQIFVIGTMMFIGYYINRVAPKTSIPSFVWAIFAGMAIQPLLATMTADINSLKIIMEVFGAIILFAGGLEVPFAVFKKWFMPIATLSLLGVMITAMAFAFGLYYLTSLFGLFEPGLVPSLVVLGAALASTDPTAIIPTLKTIKLKRKFLKPFAIAETAMTDVSGSILTNFLLIALVSAGIQDRTHILGYFLPLIQKESYDALGLEIVSGILVGYFGYVLIKKFYTQNQARHEGNDPALLLTVPIFTFVLGNMLAGAGFLASFVSGLLSDVVGGLRKVSHFYESFLDHLIKPFTFIVLGSLVPLSTLLELAPIGVISALIFMLIIRPMVVFISLLPWLYTHELKFQDLMFLSLIRETGIIAAILIVITATFDIIQSDFVIAIGMWVILLTLIVEPPLTPILAEKMQVTKK